MSFSEVFVLGIGVVRQSRPTTQSSLARAPSRARPSSIVSVLSSFGHSLSLLTICPIMDYGRRGGRSGNGLLVLVVGIARLQSQQRKSRRSELVLSAYLVSGIWYIAQAQSFIRFSMVIVLRAHVRCGIPLTNRREKNACAKCDAVNQGLP